ncbi:hypothetical protein C5167_014818 [Papaver somniferum]|uniref:Uncharacterized protein n=1 Tax=Papaver somniferum TaxID=3469 RepID=A0A4Y7J8A4_PAPSO|nr:hypothetical protein C5167_014818 [Papaver somniferum]
MSRGILVWFISSNLRFLDLDGGDCDNQLGAVEYVEEYFISSSKSQSLVRDYLGIHSLKSMRSGSLKLLGMSSMPIASEYEEIWAPEVEYLGIHSLRSMRSGAVALREVRLEKNSLFWKKCSSLTTLTKQATTQFRELRGAPPGSVNWEMQRQATARFCELSGGQMQLHTGLAFVFLLQIQLAELLKWNAGASWRCPAFGQRA